MIVVDVGTGGINPEKNPLLSIGAVDYENFNHTFYGVCKPYGNYVISEVAMKINGIDIDSIPSNQTMPKLLGDFCNYLNETSTFKILAGHNPRFDYDFLNYNSMLVNIRLPFDFRTIDLHTLAFAKFGKTNKWLSANKIYELLKMPKEPDPHNALTGAKMEAEAFKRLLNG